MQSQAVRRMHVVFEEGSMPMARLRTGDIAQQPLQGRVAQLQGQSPFALSIDVNGALAEANLGRVYT